MDFLKISLEPVYWHLKSGERLIVVEQHMVWCNVRLARKIIFSTEAAKTQIRIQDKHVQVVWFKQKKHKRKNPTIKMFALLVWRSLEK